MCIAAGVPHVCVFVRVGGSSLPSRHLGRQRPGSLCGGRLSQGPGSDGLPSPLAQSPQPAHGREQGKAQRGYRAAAGRGQGGPEAATGPLWARLPRAPGPWACLLPQSTDST